MYQYVACMLNFGTRKFANKVQSGDSSRETLRFSGNKIHCSPRDQSLSVYC